MSIAPIPNHSQLLDGAKQGELYARAVAACGPGARKVVVSITVQSKTLHKDPRVGYLVDWIDAADRPQRISHLVGATDLIATGERDVVTAMCDLLVGQIELRVRSISGESKPS